jgi:hypothetical protein
MTIERHNARIGAVVIAACAVLLGASATARAEPATGALPISQAPPQQRPAPVALNIGSPLPAHGGIVIRTPYNASTVVELRAAGATSTAIEGQLTALGPYWIWRALEPLAPGTYSLTLGGPPSGDIFASSSSSYTLNVIESWQPEVPSFTSMPTPRSIETAIETACCRVLSSDALVDGPLCPATTASFQAIVTTNLMSAAPPEQRDQFLYRARAAGVPADPEDMLFHPTGGAAAALFTEQADEYCFEVDAIDIVSLEIHTNIAVEPRCVAHGELPDFEAHAVEVADAALHRSACSAPPVGFEARWCALNELECEAMPLWCPLFGHVCRGAALPRSSLPPVLDTGGASGMSDVMTGGMGGYMIAPRDPKRRVSSGCSAAPAASSPLVALLGLALAAACFARRIRR